MIADLKPYAEYKESGLPWLGQVPKQWNLRRMKSLFRERSEKNHATEPLLAATQTKGVVRKEDYGSRTVTAVSGLQNLKLVEVGDFVISLRSFQGGIEISHARGIISPAYTVLTPQKSSEPEYFRHYFKSADFISSLTLSITGIREGQNVDYERLSRSFLPLPPPAEQAAIVRFLDWANGQLERAIRAKRKVVALLGEQKQAIVHRAVTRGLNPDVPLKPSGIPWLGEIPAHWEVRRAKYLVREVDNRSMAGEETHLAMSQRLGLVPSDSVQSTLRSESYAGGKLCDTGDIVLNRLKAHLGVFAIANQSGVVSPDYTVLRAENGVLAEYVECTLRSPACRGELKIRAKGIVEGFWRLYTDDFYTICLPAPPFGEQQHIMTAIARATLGQDNAISRLEREITLLREYRTRVVADVVTGKLDVREAAARLPDEAPLDAAEDDTDLSDESDVADEEAGE